MIPQKNIIKIKKDCVLFPVEDYLEELREATQTERQRILDIIDEMPTSWSLVAENVINRNELKQKITEDKK